MTGKFETIIWDWNGTLLDDTDFCIRSMNRLLSVRGLPELSKERYLEVFDFPVEKYYRSIGFDFSVEPFEVPALQFIDLYAEGILNCQLHQGVAKALNFFRSKRYRQVILSAMEQSKLEVSIKQFGIDTYFEAISGLGHDFATSKADNGKALMRNFGISAANTCLIGDTLHDLEVGQELGCTVVLVANGHQSFLRLVGNHSYVVSDLFELMAFFNNCQ